MVFVEFRIERIEMPQHFEKAIEKSSIETLLDVGMHNLFDFLRDSEWFSKIQRFAFSFNDIQNVTYNYQLLEYIYPNLTLSIFEAYFVENLQLSSPTKIH